MQPFKAVMLIMRLKETLKKVKTGLASALRKISGPVTVTAMDVMDYYHFTMSPPEVDHSYD